MTDDTTMNSKLEAIGFKEHEVNLILLECQENNVSVMGLFRQALRLFQNNTEEYGQLIGKNTDCPYTACTKTKHTGCYCETSRPSFSIKVAEMLVNCGYGSLKHERTVGGWCVIRKDELVVVNFTADTADGYEQANAIEDCLKDNEPALWKKSGLIYDFIAGIHSSHKYRTDRIKWCIEQLIE